MGGSEVQTLSLMKGLMARGHTVEFLGDCPVLLERSETLRAKTERLEIGIPPVTKFGALSFFWRKNAMQKKLIEALPTCDAIVMLSMSEKLLLTEEAMRRGIKVIWVEHDPVGRWLSKNPWLGNLRSLSQKVTTVVVSDISKKIYEGLGYKNVVAIPNGIDLERFSNSSLSSHSSLSSLTIGTVARLAEEKGLDVLLAAARELPQVHVKIVGEGPEESFLRNYIQDITLREGTEHPRISLMTHTDDLGAFYQSLDVFVLPSRTNDPFGLAAAEAMSLGVATIVTDACGIAGYLTHDKDALVATADNPQSLKEAVEVLLNPERRSAIAEQGQKTARELFDVNKMVEKYERIITQ